jgi:hypothetical protein
VNFLSGRATVGFSRRTQLLGVTYRDNREIILVVTRTLCELMKFVIIYLFIVVIVFVLVVFALYSLRVVCPLLFV